MSRTSLTHPLHIDSVAVSGTCSLIGMTFCPGKKQSSALSGSWSRDLDLDLEVIREWKAELVLGLMEAREYDDLDVPSLLSVQHPGFRYLHLPIPDGSVPGPGWEKSWLKKGPPVRSILMQGGRILIHCKGGLGRTGLLAALLLVEFGVHPETAIRSVREARPVTIENAVQERYIRDMLPAWERRDRFRGCLLA